MIAATPGWAVWLALSLGVTACATFGAAVVLGLRFLRRMKPTILPLLTMFGPPSDALTEEELIEALNAGPGDPGE